MQKMFALPSKSFIFNSSDYLDQYNLSNYSICNLSNYSIKWIKSIILPLNMNLFNTALQY